MSDCTLDICEASHLNTREHQRESLGLFFLKICLDSHFNSILNVVIPMIDQLGLSMSLESLSLMPKQYVK